MEDSNNLHKASYTNMDQGDQKAAETQSMLTQAFNTISNEEKASKEVGSKKLS